MSSAVAGVALGLVGGVVAWAVVQTFLTPRLRWSHVVLRRPDPTEASGWRYEVKMKNASFFRSVCGLNVRPRVYFVHSAPDRTIGRSIRLRVEPSDAHRVRPRGHLVLRVYVDAVNRGTLGRLREWGYDRAAAPDRTLEELLELPRSYFSLQTVATDSWSSSTHYLESALYLGNQVDDGEFWPRKSRLDRAVQSWNGRRRSSRRSWLRRLSQSTLHPELRHFQSDPTPRKDDEPDEGSRSARQT